MTLDPLTPYLLAETVRVCIEERLAQVEGGIPPRSCTMAGDIAWDNCECGQLVVSIVRIFTTSQFPFDPGLTAGAGPTGPDQSRCDHPILAIEYLASILRCSPSGGDDGSPPACSELDRAAQIATLDSWAVRTGIVCCLRGLRGEREITHYITRATSMVGSDGLCQGSNTEFIIGLNNSCPCADGS